MRKRKYDTQQVLNFIITYKEGHDGNSPSYREIMDGVGISSSSVVDYLLENMETQGLIVVDTNRSIRVVGGRWSIGGTSET